MTHVNPMSRTKSFSNTSSSGIESVSAIENPEASLLFISQFNADSIQTPPSSVIFPKNSLSKTSIADVGIAIEQNKAKIIFDFINAQGNVNKINYATFLKYSPSQCININISNLKELNSIEKLAHVKKDNKVKIIIKESKVLLLKKIENQLKTKLGKKIADKSSEEKKSNKFIRCLKYVGFTFMTVMGTLIGGVSSFLGMQGLLKIMFVGITAPISLAVGLFLTVVESLLFLSFEVGMLKTAMNIDHRSDIKKCLDLDEIEMSHINTIQTLLPQAANFADKTELKNYNIVRESCNNSIETIKNSFKEEIKENKIQKFVRHAVTAVGAILVVAGTYYMMTSLIAFLGTLFLVSNPLGWAILGVGLLTSLAFFLSMRGKAVVNMFVPEIAQFNELKRKAEKLEEHTIELCNIQALRKENDALKEENSHLKYHKVVSQFSVQRRKSFS